MPMLKAAKRLKAGFSALSLREFAIGRAPCPFCGVSLFLRLNASEAGLRCIRCAASTVHVSIGLAVNNAVPDLSRADAYELSALGPFVAYLRSRVRNFSCSEYHPDIAPGTEWQSVRCEDVQRLTWPDGSFDLVTHTEVFEHVPDDVRGFHELRRILRVGGRMFFTVPLTDMPHTIERARLVDGEIEHILPPEFHTDPFKGNSQVLVFRDYGLDITDRLKDAGFTDIRIKAPDFPVKWSRLRPVISARAA
jgi:SAM-dependent methyltransferase